MTPFAAVSLGQTTYALAVRLVSVASRLASRRRDGVSRWCHPRAPTKPAPPGQFQIVQRKGSSLVAQPFTSSTCRVSGCRTSPHRPSRICQADPTTVSKYEAFSLDSSDWPIPPVSLSSADWSIPPVSSPPFFTRVTGTDSKSNRPSFPARTDLLPGRLRIDGHTHTHARREPIGGSTDRSSPKGLCDLFDLVSGQHEADGDYAAEWLVDFLNYQCTPSIDRSTHRSVSRQAGSVSAVQPRPLDWAALRLWLSRPWEYLTASALVSETGGCFCLTLVQPRPFSLPVLPPSPRLSGAATPP
ncbi:unnamed protein product [Protopolystoma xenopodis]|uniref:Uncharacterized protein n=1 Tax=Protopolystoma xenopodis TaxID=117903 RepID=A0A3S4ZP21_9PLAT|nr:unnamed protein product [Protopolystoma xenopodis]